MSEAGRPFAGAAALARFFAALARAEAGQRTRPVHVLQIGDSHSAADHIAGRLRERLQARFGIGGRGILPPGRPFERFAPRQVTLEQSPGWSLDGEGAGLSGWRATAEAAGETVRLEAAAEAVFDRLVVCGNGAFDIVADGEVQPVELGAARRCGSFEFEGGRSELVLRAREAGARLFSFATFRRSGALWSSLGVIGAQLRDLARRDGRIVAAELEAYRPDLILLAFGTNEAFDTGFDAHGYEAVLRAEIGRFTRLAPEAALLLVGPPDAGEPPSTALATVSAAQTRAAAEMGAAFWDWRARMGGPGSAAALVAKGMMMADHVHFTSAGGERVGDLLWSDLMPAYEEWMPSR